MAPFPLAARCTSLLYQKWGQSWQDGGNRRQESDSFEHVLVTRLELAFTSLILRP